MRWKQTDNRGFTLLEVMVAVAILAISLTALFGSQSASVALATETRFNTQAPLLARMKLAELQVAGELFSGEGDFGDTFPNFTWELSTEEAFFDESELLKNLDGKLQHLTLTVRWGEDEYSYQLDSYWKSDDEQQ